MAPLSPHDSSIWKPSAEAGKGNATRSPEFHKALAGPVRLIQGLARAWKLGDDELSILLAYDDSSLARALLNGVLPLQGADREDRVRLMWLIHDTLADLFVDPADEGRWIRTALDVLKGQTPLERMIARRIPGLIDIRDLVDQRLANR